MNCNVRIAVCVVGMVNSPFPMDYRAGRSLSKTGEVAVWYM